MEPYNIREFIQLVNILAMCQAMQLLFDWRKMSPFIFLSCVLTGDFHSPQYIQLLMYGPICRYNFTINTFDC